MTNLEDPEPNNKGDLSCAVLIPPEGSGARIETYFRRVASVYYGRPYHRVSVPHEAFVALENTGASVEEMAALIWRYTREGLCSHTAHLCCAFGPDGTKRRSIYGFSDWLRVADGSPLQGITDEAQTADPDTLYEEKNMALPSVGEAYVEPETGLRRRLRSGQGCAVGAVAVLEDPATKRYVDVGTRITRKASRTVDPDTPHGLALYFDEKARLAGFFAAPTNISALRKHFADLQFPECSDGEVRLFVEPKQIRKMIDLFFSPFSRMTRKDVAPWKSFLARKVELLNRTYPDIRDERMRTPRPMTPEIASRLAETEAKFRAQQALDAKRTEDARLAAEAKEALESTPEWKAEQREKFARKMAVLDKFYGRRPTVIHKPKPR